LAVARARQSGLDFRKHATGAGAHDDDVSFSQFFVAAAKQASEEGKAALPIIDVTAEPILALPGLTNTRDGAAAKQWVG
jgi:hypothetical protein